MTELERTIVVGISDDQSDAVLLVAAAVAQQFAARLICVEVDPSRYAARDGAGRSVLVPIDPDDVDGEEAEQADERAVRERLADVLAHSGVAWTVRVVAGDPAAGLARVASEVSALMIVIGTGRRTVQRSLRELLTGSVAAHLAHRQPRPILVVPLDPVADGDPLPWRDPA